MVLCTLGRVKDLGHFNGLCVFHAAIEQKSTREVRGREEETSLSMEISKSRGKARWRERRLDYLIGKY